MTNRNLVAMTVAIVMALGSSANAELVGHWTFDNEDLTNSATTGSVHDGRGIGATNYATGPNGNAALDLTTGNSYVTINGTSRFRDNYQNTFDEELAKGMTIAFWAAGVPDRGWSPFIAKGTDGFQVRRYNETTNVSWTLRGDGGGDTNAGVITEGWQHYAAVWTRAQRLLYINGVLVDTADGPTTLTTDPARDLRFGFNGERGISRVKLDDIRIYNEGLSFAQLGAENISGVSFGSFNPNPPNPSPVPTPAALPAGLAMIGLAAMRRRRR